MVVSEIVAATMIAVYGLRNSYRIVLKAERLIRGKIRRPAPIIEGYHSFPRFFIRNVFRAGLEIAMRWEGRAKNAAQLAADARLRAKRTSRAVAHRIEDVRHRAEDVRDRAKDQTRIMREKAAELRERAGHAKDRAVAARDKLLDMKDKVQQRVSPKANSRKFFTDARSILPPEGKPLPMVHTRIYET